MKKKKKKKFDREKFVNKPNGVFFVELKSWMSIREAVKLRSGTPKEKEFIRLKYLGPDEMKRQRRRQRMRDKVVDCLIELFEDHLASDSSNRVIINPTEGKLLYEGLEEIIDREGIDPKNVDIQAVNDAWREFRNIYPIFPKTSGVHPRYIEKDSGVNANGEPKRQRSLSGPRKSLFGHDISSVIRKMGFEGLDFDEAKKVLKHYGIDVKDTTIRGQLWCGTQSGKYGLCARLTEKQLDEIIYISMAKEK